MQAIGYPLAVFNGILMIGSAFVFGIAGMLTASVVTTATFGALTLGSFCMGLAGYSMRSRAKRFKQYVERLSGKDFCTVEELALSVGRKKEFVLKDLEKMVQKRFFRQGRFD